MSRAGIFRALFMGVSGAELYVRPPEGRMSRRKSIRCSEAAFGLPLPKQAVCLRFAAEASTPVWREWCERRRGVGLHPANSFDTFGLWLESAAFG